MTSMWTQTFQSILNFLRTATRKMEQNGERQKKHRKIK